MRKDQIRQIDSIGEIIEKLQLILYKKKNSIIIYYATNGSSIDWTWLIYTRIIFTICSIFSFFFFFTRRAKKIK